MLTATPAALLATAATALGAAADRGGAGVVDLLERAGATVTALTVVGGGLWWLLRPRVQTYVRQQQAAASMLVVPPAVDDVDRRHGLGPLPAKLGALEVMLTAHLADARAGFHALERLQEQVVRNLGRLEVIETDLARTQEQVDELDSRVAEYLAEAAAELRLARAARVMAELGAPPHHREEPSND